MKAKHVSSILIFSLLTLAVCNNIKTADEGSSDNVPKKTSKVAVLAARYNQTVERFDVLKRTFDSFKKQNPEGSTELTACELALANCNENSDAIRDDLDRCNQKTNELEQQLSDAQTQLVTVSEESSIRQKTITELTSQCNLNEENFAKTHNLLSKYENVYSTPQEMKVKLSELHQKNMQQKKIINSFKKRDGSQRDLESRLQSETKKSSEAQAQYESKLSTLAEERDNLGEALDEVNKDGGLREQADNWNTHKCSLSQADERLNRCLPYIYGLGIAVGADYALSYLSTVERLAKHKKFKLFHQSVQDARNSQFFSLPVAGYGGQLHAALNGSSTEVGTLEDDLATGAKNVAGEVINAFALRLGWNKLITHPSIASHLKKIGNYRIVKAVPEPVKQSCQALVRSLVIRTFWNLEKTQLGL